MKHAKEKRGRRLAEGLVAAVTVVAAVVALTAGGTLAYFSASERAHNVITSGGVGIDLREWADLERTRPFEDVEGVMPGESVTKMVEVANDGPQPAWVRVRADLSAVSGISQEALPEVAEAVSIDWNEDDWTQGDDGWWYYGKALAPGDVAEPLFTAVSFGGSGMGDAYQSCTVAVDVSAQAVQTANNGASALDAEGWPQTQAEE